MHLPELKSTFTVQPPNAWGQQPFVHAERWLAPEWTMLPLTARQCRVRNPVTGSVAELSAEQYAVLRACEGCRTLAEHASIVRQSLNVRAEGTATIAQWLDNFAAAGLLTSLTDLVQRLTPASDLSPAPFAGVFVRTCDRPRLLQRVLASAAHVGERHATQYRYTVLDDSRDPNLRAENRNVVAGHPHVACMYVDLSSPTALERDLRRRLPDAQAAIDWLIGVPALGEASYGRPINCALLMSAGRRLLLLDDDAVLGPRQPPVRSSQFAVSATPDELFCYVDERALDADCPPADVDPIAAHLDALGYSVQSLWTRFLQSSVQAPTVALDAEDAPRFNASARALLTQNHALGDPGSSLFPFHLLSLPPASQMRLSRDPALARSAFERRINWRGQPHPRLATRRPFTLTTLAGIDNSAIIPPTARSQRNEDLLLGEMAQHVYPGAWLVDLAFALPHWRDPPKVWLDAATPFAQEPIHFLMDYVAQRAASISSESAEHRLRTIAAFLHDLSGASERRVVDLLVEQAADTATRTLFSIAAQLDTPTLPDAWKDRLRPWLSSPALSTDRATLRTRIASVATVRSLAVNYGSALEVWPTLWNTAREYFEHERPGADVTK